MKKTVMLLGVIGLSSVATLLYSPTAEALSGPGVIEFQGEEPGTEIIDPENPETETDPGPSPSTDGRLRIAFVPQLNFSSDHVITDKEMVYPVEAQLFHSETAARGNFVQIADNRGAALGWSLQVRQEQQFTNQAGATLNGAVLSFGHSWTSGNKAGQTAPTVSKDVIYLNQVGETYNLAEAKQGEANGTWSISFGASAENKNDQGNTLVPKLDGSGKEIIDPTFNKPVMTNSAIQLAVPGATEKQAGEYTTVLTWTLAELP